MDTLMQQIAAINVQADYQKTLALLRAMKAGEVSLDCVLLAGEGWTLLPPGAQVVTLAPRSVDDPDFIKARDEILAAASNGEGQGK